MNAYLELGFKTAHPMPQEYGDAAFGLIKQVSTHPHPTPDVEEQYGPPNMSPLDLSLNSVRSQALAVAIEYGCWKYRLDPGSSFADVISLVDSHLDPKDDPSVAVRSVIGRNFSNLLAFDEAWAVASADRIFPDAAPLRHLWEAAWDGYLWGGIRNRPTWLALKGRYDLAVARIGGDPDDRGQRGRDEALANHLASLYWWGELDLHEGPLAKLISIADEALRTHVLVTIGRGLVADGHPLEPAVVERLFALWNSRVEAVRSSHGAELSAFGWWFVADRFPVDKRLLGLRQALELSGY